jgi:hypothetical protein
MAELDFTEAKPVADTELSAADAVEPEQDGKPDWLPSNFASPEELAKSYAHSVRKLTSMGQQNAELKRELARLTAENDSLRLAQQEFNERVSWLERLFVRRQAGGVA